MRHLLLPVILLSTIILQAQQPGRWKGYLLRQDNIEVVFEFDVLKNGQLVIVNGAERLPFIGVKRMGDSLFFETPTFESAFRTRIENTGYLSGQWVKGTATNTQNWSFRAVLDPSPRFPKTKPPIFDVSGRWKVDIKRPNGTLRPAIAEFKQTKDKLFGTFLTPSGDYRFLEGRVNGDSVYMSVFDGAHVYLFTAHITGKDNIESGIFLSGYNGKETWVARRDANAQLPDVGNAPEMLAGEERLSFRFPDLDSQMVSSNDDRFRNKVVIVQLMGSWCPNCMDETKFLSELYGTYNKKGVEIVALAYENSTDFRRSRNSLLKFKERFNVKYPMLITGAWVNDSLRTQKTLPQLSPIKVFPTTIYIGKDGKVKKIHAGFYGPGTGAHYEGLKKEVEEWVEREVGGKL